VTGRSRLLERLDGRAREVGQGIVEYGLILALTSLFTVLILGVFGGVVADVLGAIGAAIDAATGG
jgi:Flp pilus assembly pilin Flp